MDEKEIKFIVDGLNKAPFQQRLTLVSFAQKAPLELLQCLSDVFAALDQGQKKDLRDEQNDATAVRLLSFLAVLSYKIDADLVRFKDQLMKGSQGTIYPILRWILERVPELKKRAYLARFLRPCDVPEEFFAEPTIVALFQRHKELQAEFKEIHKTVDKIRGNSLNPAELEAENKQLESEREQLTTKLARLRDKVTKGAEFQNVNFDEVLRSTNNLRHEQEEESKLAGSLREQKQMLSKSEQELRAAQARLKELESSDLVRADPMTLLSRLRDQVRRQRDQDEKLEKDLREKEKAVRELEHELISDPITADQVEELEEEIGQMTREINSLTAKRDALNNSGDGQLGFIRDRATAVEKKREKVLEQLAEIEDEKKEAEEEIRRLNNELKLLMVNGEKPRTEAQMKQYTKDLAKKTNQYKALKADLQYEKDEVAVLMRTEEILKSRTPNLAEFMEGFERERSMQQNLENVSEQTAAANAAKAQSLDEISAYVKQLSANLKQRKTKLAPQIKELRAVRQRFEQVDADYAQRKKIYDAMVSSVQSERIRLEQEVQGNYADILSDESQYFMLNCQASINQARMEQVMAEQKYIGGEAKLDEAFKSYKDMYDKIIEQQEALAKRLREEKKNIKETHEDNVGQRQMFLHLRKLLSMKLKINKDAKAASDQRRVERVDLEGTENILKLDDGGGGGDLID